jgi:cation:H+ antiporter
MIEALISFFNNMNPIFLILSYGLIAALVIYATNKASFYVDQFDQKTQIGGAIIGGVLLATITSLPELITSLTSTSLLNQPGLAFGNVFGSNLVNLFILAIGDLVFVNQMMFNRVKTQRKTTLIIIVMYIIFLIPYTLSTISSLSFESFTVSFGLTFNVVSILIILAYILSVFLMNNDEEESVEEENSDTDISLKHVVIKFTMWSALVILASVFLTYNVSGISNAFSLQQSFAGAIFLGVATSLPEFTAVITLLKLGNREAALGNIVGSNIFNLTIISVVDLLNTTKDIFGELVNVPDTKENVFFLLILGLINSIILVLALYRTNCNSKRIYMIPSIIIIVVYAVYVGLSVWT